MPTITGTSGPDLIVPTTPGDYLIYGLPGDDTIGIGYSGNSTIVGGQDDDVLIFVPFAGGGGPGQGVIYGNLGADSMFATDQATMFGGQGDDSIAAVAGTFNLSGNLGNDTIVMATAAGTISGGAGRDSITVGNGSSLIYGNDGIDTIHVFNGQHTVFAGQGDDYVLATGTGHFGIYGNFGDDTIVFGADHGVFSVFGGQGDDVIFGAVGSHEVSLAGNLGDDTIVAGGGGTYTGTVDGGGGNDFLYVQNGHMTMTGGTGADTIQIETGGGAIYGNQGDDQLFINAVSDARIFGGQGDDSIGLVGVPTSNGAIYGNLGNDTLSLRVELLPDGDGPSALFGDAHLFGGQGDDVLVGGANPFHVAGNTGFWFIGAVEELFTDTMTGGTGADRFVFDFVGHTNGVGHPIGIASAASLEITDLSSNDTLVFNDLATAGVVRDHFNTVSELDAFATVTDHGAGNNVDIVFHTTGAGHTITITLDGAGTGAIHSLSNLAAVYHIAFI